MREIGTRIERRLGHNQRSIHPCGLRFWCRSLAKEGLASIKTNWMAFARRSANSSLCISVALLSQNVMRRDMLLEMLIQIKRNLHHWHLGYTDALFNVPAIFKIAHKIRVNQLESHSFSAGVKLTPLPWPSKKHFGLAVCDSNLTRIQLYSNCVHQSIYIHTSVTGSLLCLKHLLEITLNLQHICSVHAQI